MKHRLALLIAVLLILIVSIWIICSRPGNTTLRAALFSSGGKPAPSVDSTSPDDSSPDAGPSARPKRPPLQKKNPDSKKLDEQLEADGLEVVARSVVHTVIPEGKSMVTGGYLTQEGRYEFCVISPKWVAHPPGTPRQILFETKILRADPQALEKSGLQSLVTHEQNTSQNAEVWSPEDLAATLAAGEGGVAVVCSPIIFTQPGSEAEIGSGSNGDAFGIHLEATEAPGVGFELKSDLRHLK